MPLSYSTRFVENPVSHYLCKGLEQKNVTFICGHKIMCEVVLVCTAFARHVGTVELVWMLSDGTGNGIPLSRPLGDAAILYDSSVRFRSGQFRSGQFE